MKLLSILIVNWNTRDLLRSCLHSLQKECDGIEHEIIVVDNASSDGSAQMLSGEFPDVCTVASPENLGFAVGNNVAYEKSRGDIVWLLNPDTEVLRGSPQLLLGFLSTHPQCGGVASALIDAQTGSPQRSCRVFPSPAALWVEALGLARKYPRSRRFGFYRMGWWRYHDTRQVEQPMAASFMLPREAIEKSGGLFDKDFPIYFNDVDLCWRLIESGFEIWYCHAAKLLHHGAASTKQVKPEMIAQSHQSLLRFYEKHYLETLHPLIFAATSALVSASGKWRVWRSGR